MYAVISLFDCPIVKCSVPLITVKAGFAIMQPINSDYKYAIIILHDLIADNGEFNRIICQLNNLRKARKLLKALASNTLFTSKALVDSFIGDKVLIKLLGNCILDYATNYNINLVTKARKVAL